MKVYCVMEWLAESNSTELKGIFSTFNKAMEDAKWYAEEYVKGYSQTRSVVQFEDRYVVKWEEEDDVETEDICAIAVYYIQEGEVVED